MILQVHDELNFSVPEAEKEIIQKIVIEEMERAYRMLVPLKADFGWGKNCALIRSITLFNLQSESNRSNRFKIQFAHQNIRHLCCRIFFTH